MEFSVVQKIRDDVHLFVRNAYYLNHLLAKQVKDDVVALREAVVTLTHIQAVLSRLRIFGSPDVASAARSR
jgi:hypothetical protein